MDQITSLPWRYDDLKTFVDGINKVGVKILPSAPAELVAVARKAVALWAMKVPLPLTPSDSLPIQTSTLTQIVESVTFAFKFGGLDACGNVVSRILRDELFTDDYVELILLPLVPSLREIPMLKGLPVTRDPFASALRRIMRLWAAYLLPPVPVEDPNVLKTVQHWTCTCEQCAAIRPYLCTDTDGAPSLVLEKIGARKRKHVEAELVRYASRQATFDTISTTPQGLKVTKTDELYKPIQWRRERLRARGLLAKISDDELELAQVLGDFRQELFGLIGWEYRELPNAGPMAPSSSASILKRKVSNSTLADEDEPAPRKFKKELSPETLERHVSENLRPESS